MKLRQKELLQIAHSTISNLKKEFRDDIHSSGSLVKSIEITKHGREVNLIIHAPRYNRKKFYEQYTKKRPERRPPKNEIIIKPYYGQGSYASELDLKGAQYWVTQRKGPAKLRQTDKHKGYVQRAVDAAIEEFCYYHSCEAEKKE